jgi:hypothetical protein
MSNVSQNYNAVRVTFGNNVLYANTYRSFDANLNAALKALCIVLDLCLESNYTYKDLLEDYAIKTDTTFMIEAYRSY